VPHVRYNLAFTVVYQPAEDIKTLSNYKDIKVRLCVDWIGKRDFHLSILKRTKYYGTSFFFPPHIIYFDFLLTKKKLKVIQCGPEKILLETMDSFVVNSNFCEPPCKVYKSIKKSISDGNGFLNAASS